MSGRERSMAHKLRMDSRRGGSMNAITSTRESARALMACIPDPHERRAILAALIRERAVAIAIELLTEAAPEQPPQE